MATTKQAATPAISVETHTKWVSGLADNDVGVTIRFSDGEELYLGESMVSEDVRRHALAHGFKQKLVDAAAMSRNPDTGRAATLADKKAAVGEVYARLLAGEWNKVREGGAVGGLLLSAVIRLYPSKTADELKAWLDGKTDEQKAALRVNPKIAPIIAAIKAERAKEQPDTDGLLAELE